ncbi:hypothetical protein M1116_04330 [Patescibacteria group bacterium]|nr:hypothetical protein [Patescibacteria group bacterium]
MNRQTQKVIRFVLHLLRKESAIFFWFLLRFISALFPLLTVYLFSEIIKLIEQKATLTAVAFTFLLLLVVRLVDNFSRLLSIARLEYHISNLNSAIHNYFIADLKTETKEERHESVQAIRNFADASCLLLRLVRQPGIDSLVSLVFTPLILFIVDFRVAILEVAYILVYYFIDVYTTQRYRHLRDIQNTKTEVYYAKLQETNDIDLEQNSFNRHYNRLARWYFAEWSFLQNAAVSFYVLIFFFLVVEVMNGHKDISDVVLIMGYVANTQVFLNSFSDIQDSLTDMSIALEHLAKNKTISVLDLDDLM